jgi:diketogulonate reductase-like aldo/keto reductase
VNILPKLALGTWLMGGTKSPDPNNDDARDITVIQTAIESGITLIDTAQNYAGGKCEEIVGQAVKKYPREAYQILTKQSKAKLSYDEVIQGCHDSMARLGIEFIDYFVCHAPNADFDMSEFFKASNKLYKDGYIRHVGVSNFGPKTLQIALDTSDVPIALNQVSFSLQDDDIISTGTYDFCVKNNIPIQAYRTLVGLKEGIDPAVQKIADVHSISPQQVVIAYLNNCEDIHFTLRASTAQHWQEIKDALDLKLSDTEIEQLYALQKDTQGNFRELLLI